VSESPLRCSICSRGPGETSWLRWVYNKQSKLRRPVGGRCMDCNKMVQSALERKVFGPDVCTANAVWKHKGLRSRATSYRDEWCRMSPAERLRAHMGAVGQQAVQLVETDEAVLTTTPYDLLPLEEPLQDKDAMCEIVTYQGRNYIRKPASSLSPPPGAYRIQGRKALSACSTLTSDKESAKSLWMDFHRDNERTAASTTFLQEDIFSVSKFER
ncbi:unnamed protein product, partial [Durusdinium trenchii]